MEEGEEGKGRPSSRVGGEVENVSLAAAQDPVLAQCRATFGEGTRDDPESRDPRGRHPFSTGFGVLRAKALLPPTLS